MWETMIEELGDLVENACKAETNVFGYGIWSHHIRPMVDLARTMAPEYGADRQIVTIAVLLHDLAGIEDHTKQKLHHIHGAMRAKEILSAYGYPPQQIEAVTCCIRNHRGSENLPKDTPEEQCVADADAVIHLREIGSLFFVAYDKKSLSIEEGTKWVHDKLERDFAKLSDRGKKRYKTDFGIVLASLGSTIPTIMPIEA